MSHMLFSGYDQFQVANPPSPKFSAFHEALQKAEREPHTYARSVGVSVTYWTAKPEVAPLVAHRTYQTIIRARECALQLVLAQVEDLVPISSYDDTTDSESFDGTGQLVLLQPGEFLFVEPDQAWAFAAVPEGTVDIFRLTVAGPAVRAFGVGA